jgi:hypothetical protein
MPGECRVSTVFVIGLQDVDGRHSPAMTRRAKPRFQSGRVGRKVGVELAVTGILDPLAA